MPLKLHILKSSGRLLRFEPVIVLAFDAAIKAVEKKIKLPDIDVVIDDDESRAIPETGVGGLAVSPHVAFLHIDPNFKGLENVLDAEIRSTLAHELNHCARWHVKGYGTTLLEAIVSEGLADHFDIEVMGGDPKPWSVSLRGDELPRMMDRAKDEFFAPNYNHNAWFFGSDAEKIPRWAGYALGYSIVGTYMKKSGKKASELVYEDAKVFI